MPSVHSQKRTLERHTGARRVMAERNSKRERRGKELEAMCVASQVLLMREGSEIAIVRRCRAVKVGGAEGEEEEDGNLHGNEGIASSCGVRRSSLNVRRRGASVKMEKRKSSRKTDFG